MRYLAGTSAIVTALVLAAFAGPGAAETVRSDVYEATADRRSVALQSQSGAKISAQQVLLSVRRLDGQPAGPGALDFAERIACGGAVPVVSLTIGQSGASARYDILCRKGG